MSPVLASLALILRDAADDDITTEHTLARLRRANYTPDRDELAAAVTAIVALRELADGACVHLATEGAAPGIDRRALAVEEQERRLDEAVSVLSRRPEVAVA